LPIKNRIGWQETKTTPPSLRSLFPGSTSFFHSHLLQPHPTTVQGDGEQRSVHNSSSLPLLAPHIFPLLQCGTFPRGTILHKLHGSLPWATAPARKPAPVHGLQSLPGACSSTGSPRATASSRVRPPALAWGSSRATGWVSAPAWSSLQATG